jgi:hypothetical protein
MKQASSAFDWFTDQLSDAGSLVSQAVGAWEDVKTGAASIATLIGTAVGEWFSQLNMGGVMQTMTDAVSTSSLGTFSADAIVALQGAGYDQEIEGHTRQMAKEFREFNQRDRNRKPRLIGQ